MLTLLVIVSHQLNGSAPRSRLSTSSRVTKSPVVHPLSIQPLTKCPSRNSFIFKTIHFDGGVYPLYVQTFRRLDAFPSYPLSFHILEHSFALFCTYKNHNSFVSKRFRTLRQKTQLPEAGEGMPT